ncbi:hypothetical protein [Sphingobacterium sp.]|uniref:hypothetical protein n=1 Tax=Sphingobacterium sp. TaxID=341027 RepID=UPI0031E3C50A
MRKSSGKSKKERKHGEAYDLSENSKLTGLDFTYNCKLAGRLYKILKPIQPQACERSTYIRLQDALYAAVRKDREHDLGSLRLGYGSVLPLKGFRYSKRGSWNNFFMNYPSVHFDEARQQVKIRLQWIGVRKFNSIHERLEKLDLKIHCIVIQLDDRNTLFHQASKTLELKKEDHNVDRGVTFTLEDCRDAVILCMASVRCWLTTLDGREEFMSNSSTLMTGEIFDALLIRGGKLTIFPEEKSDKLPPPILPGQDDEVDWD